jgi:hypothetical protein
VLHANQFQVNEAWIAFKLNEGAIHTENDGDFNFLALMDAASCFINLRVSDESHSFVASSHTTRNPLR